MLHSPLLIPPSAAFWDEAARALLTHVLPAAMQRPAAPDLSALRVVVPTLGHIPQLRAALVRQLGALFIAPRIVTAAAWCAQLPPQPATPQPASDAERLMSLYAALRQHAWLKKLFTARRNTDLLPLAQMILTLSDELTHSLLPAVRLGPDGAAMLDARWQGALEQLSPASRRLLSDEAQLVWSIWKSQLDGHDAIARRFAHMMRLAGQATEPLVWITPLAPDAFDQAFLQAYGERQPVWRVMLDWRRAALDPTLAAAWDEMLDDAAPAVTDGRALAPPAGLALCAADSLEQQAQLGAQTILDWLQAGKSRLAIVAQDRVVARRIRALLERAQVALADETGWKLSTTRAASVIAAWFEVVAARAETVALLDLLKSPFLWADAADKSMQVMAIESALRRHNVPGGWDAVDGALAQLPLQRAALLSMAQQAGLFAGRKTLAQWGAATAATLQALGMHAALQADAAGAQVIALLETLGADCDTLDLSFSFAEWRACVGLQLESTAFVPPDADRRVVMLALNGARLRSFDAVLLVGADADHLPSQPNETLFFANAVRRELGLATRESRQRQQLRDLAELLGSNRTVVLSWQRHKEGEPNPPSPWIERLQLVLARAGAALPAHPVGIAARHLTPLPQAMPAPAAPHLLPDRLSAGGYNSLVACPYQFFATRMLGLSGLDELSDLPEKRDYGDWLHRILRIYHETVRDEQVALDRRAALLRAVSEKIFGAALAQSAAALGYYMRWQKALPAYLDWANAREAQGWHFVLGEERFEKTLSWPGGAVTLHGRIDRIDRQEDGAYAVLDYKTRNAQALRDKLRQREDHQLAFYGLLSEHAVASAHYVALETMKDKTGDAEAPQYAVWQQALRGQIADSMEAIGAGATLPASGVEAVCRFCEVRGLCRKGAW